MPIFSLNYARLEQDFISRISSPVFGEDIVTSGVQRIGEDFWMVGIGGKSSGRFDTTDSAASMTLAAISQLPKMRSAMGNQAPSNVRLAASARAVDAMTTAMPPRPPARR